ncbi:hypothetical protein BDB00DRAFT_180293 [Zychaea mexicana]|uniref:uncharacterized protein n=1 Tax=Zychaea mexicana TaxID=64656 RepID=UPI0022FDC4D9|nr:uncharacterized protein BDB00DRAFT_180293 [Zychaea mexicana]KAI9495998.1 hypothetical protein BDB00DRAFT_180293 [Zychaea mexicana]
MSMGLTLFLAESFSYVVGRTVGMPAQASFRRGRAPLLKNVSFIFYEILDMRMSDSLCSRCLVSFTSNPIFIAWGKLEGRRLQSSFLICPLVNRRSLSLIALMA